MDRKQSRHQYSQTQDIMPERNIVSFHFQLLILSSILGFLQQVSFSSTLRHKSNQPWYWVKFSGDA